MFNTIFLQKSAAGGMNPMMMVIFGLMFVVMYFFMIRPQQKKQKEQKNFMTELKKGDKVVTMGGIHGKIVQVSEDTPTILLEISEGTKIKIDKSVISLEYSLAANSTGKE